MRGGLLVGSPLGVFQLVGMSLVWLPMNLVGMLWFWMGIVLLFQYQVLGVTLGSTGLVVLVEALKESD